MNPDRMITADYLNSIGLGKTKAVDYMLEAALKRQISGEFKTIEEARAWVIRVADIYFQLSSNCDEDGRVLSNPMKIKWPGTSNGAA